MKEIEKKYLVSSIIDLEKYEKIEVEQGYLNTTNPVIRIRKYGNEFFLTYKSRLRSDKELNVAEEYEFPLSEDAYNNLKRKIDTNLIHKDRYLIPLKDGRVAELDIYHDKLEGLKTVEVEFDSMKAYKNFVKPSWFGEDITGVKKYFNSQLSKTNSLKDLM
jgi:CYTH domain-containing protein